MALALLFVQGTAVAGPMQFWSDEGWTQFNDKAATEDGEVEPGAGGQSFDAEYLYYRLDGYVLSIGLQAGYDLVDGLVTYGNKDYFAGDLALSFDGDVTLGGSTTYEYGFDFGLYTESYNSNPGAIDFGSGTGIDTAGLYRVTGWSEDIYHGHAASNPYAIDDIDSNLGSLGGTTTAGKEGVSYFRIVSFDLAGLNANEVDAHWTMSCGNDNINGGFTVPEPGALAILLMGLFCLGGARVRRRRTGATAIAA